MSRDVGAAGSGASMEGLSGAHHGDGSISKNVAEFSL